MAIPFVAIPAAFAGAFVVGRLATGSGGTGAGTEADPTAAATDAAATPADDGWGGYDSSGAQFPGGDTGGVLPTPIGGGYDDPGYDGGGTAVQPIPGGNTRPPAVTPAPGSTAAPGSPSTPRTPRPLPPRKTVPRPSTGAPSGTAGWAHFPAGAVRVFDATGSWTGTYPVATTSGRMNGTAGSRWVSGVRAARLPNGQFVNVRRIDNGRGGWSNTFATATGYQVNSSATPRA